MTLDEIAIKYGTDKSSLTHNYTPFYEKNLPNSPKKFLEIGVLNGASIKMWLEYFPETEVHGLDLFTENEPTELIKWAEEKGYSHRLFLHQGNQCDFVLLDKLRHENFDIIIDDGSHNSRDQMMTFYGLFNGGQYYIEDTHCNLNTFYSQGLPLSLTAFETFIFLNGERPGVKEMVNVTYGNNIILVNTMSGL